MTGRKGACVMLRLTNILGVVSNYSLYWFHIGVTRSGDLDLLKWILLLCYHNVVKVNRVRDTSFHGFSFGHPSEDSKQLLAVESVLEGHFNRKMEFKVFRPGFDNGFVFTLRIPHQAILINLHNSWHWNRYIHVAILRCLPSPDYCECNQVLVS